MELFIQMNKIFGTTIILATHSQKLMDIYKFPKIIVENHRVTFTSHGNSIENADAIKLWKGPKPKNYFEDLSQQLDKIGGQN